MAEQSKPQVEVLVVQTAFGDYQRGDQISDVAEMKRVSETHSQHVTRAFVPADSLRDAAAKAPPKSAA
jgi:hypothetical protein